MPPYWAHAVLSDTPSVSLSVLSPCWLAAVHMLCFAVLCYAMLCCAALRCGALRCAVRCGAVRCGAVRCDAVRCGAMRCDAMRCDAMRCDVQVWARSKWRQLPFHSIEQPGGRRAAAVALYLRRLLSRVRALNGQSPREFVRSVYKRGHGAIKVSLGAPTEDAAAVAVATRDTIGGEACEALSSATPPTLAEVMA